jgi:glycosyltransferase involved in cell wall biosynthesis
VLLQVVAALRASNPAIRLVRVGGALTPEQDELARALGINDSIVHLPRLETEDVAAVYRRAALLLLPTEAEGFGFPVVEALASGTPVVASDLPVLREVGGCAVTYQPVGDVGGWERCLVRLLHERSADPRAWQRRREMGFQQAARFSWHAFAAGMATVYREVFAS